MEKARPILTILLLTAALVAAWTVAVGWLPGRPVVAESNYQANLLRLQNFAHGPGHRAVLVGSSITGRLLPEYFQGTALDGAVNLGLDGSGPALGLELIAAGSNQPAAVVIEANLLGVPQGENDRALREAFDGFTFRLARVLPWLRAENRPSTRLYDWVKRVMERRGRQGSAAGSAPGPGLDPVAQHFRLNRQSAEAREAHRRHVRGLLELLKGRGLRLMLVRYPREGLDDAGREPDFDDELARDLKIRHLELGRRMTAMGHRPSYTDGTHFAPASARVAARLIVEALADQGQEPGVRP